MGNGESEPVNETTTLIKSPDQILYNETCKQLDQACRNFTLTAGRCYNCSFRDDHSMYCPERKSDTHLPIWSKGIAGTCSECTDRSVYKSTMGATLCEKHAQDVIAGHVEYFPRRAVLHKRMKESEARFNYHRSVLEADRINSTFGFGNDGMGKVTAYRPPDLVLSSDRVYRQTDLTEVTVGNGGFDVYRPDGKLIGSMTITPTTTIAQFREAIMGMEAMQRGQTVQQNKEVSTVEVLGE